MSQVEVQVRTTGGRQSAEQIRGIGRAAREVQGQVKGLSGAAGGLGKMLGRAAKLGAAFIGGAALMSTTRNIIKQQREIYALGAAAGLTGREFQGLQQRALALSSATGVASDQIVSTAAQIVDSGRDLSEAFQIIEKLGPIASGFGRDLGVLANGADQAARQFGVGLDEYTEGLATAFRIEGGVANLEDLASITADLGPLAKAAGFSFDSLLDTFAGFSREMGDSQMAATALQRIMTRIGGIKPRAEFMKLMDESGMAARFGITEEVVQDPAQLIAALGQVFREGSANMQQEIIEALGIDTRQELAFRAAVSTFTAGTTAAVNRQEALAEVTARAAEIQQSAGFRFNDAVNRLQNAILESQLIDRLAELTPLLSQLIDDVGTVMRGLNKFLGLDQRGPQEVRQDDGTVGVFVGKGPQWWQDSAGQVPLIGDWLTQGRRVGTKVPEEILERGRQRSAMRALERNSNAGVNADGSPSANMPTSTDVTVPLTVNVTNEPGVGTTVEVQRDGRTVQRQRTSERMDN